VHALRVLDENRMETPAVAVMEHALADTQRAFDHVAAEYDRSNAANPLLTAMRARVLSAIVAHTPPGGRILDLGCGPGADEEMLARAGYTVTAIDWSAAMVDQTRARIARAGLEDRVEVHHLGIHELDRLAAARFDTVCSNLGPLNCVPSLRDAMRLAADRVRPGGALVASVIGRVCPWEIALYAARGNLARVAVRFARDLTPVPLSGRTVWTRYYTPAGFERACGACGLSRISLRALGLFVPPPYMDGFATRHPALVTRLQRLEDFAGGWPLVRSLGDHFLMVLRKS
jgi:2-polyprenyl-3-methyl-5-hydroxy-6-metoxy-1,4-benzoquinol methylase